MFAIKKLVLVAACVALALGPAVVVAEPQSSHLRVRVHEHAAKAVKQASAGSAADLGATVGGSSDGDDIDGSDDSDDSDDSEEGKDPAGSSGSAATAGEAGDENLGVLNTAATTTAPPADADGTGGAATEEPAVDVVVEVVSEPTEAPPSSDKPFCSGEGEYQVSVEYAEGIYCVKGQACVAGQTDGVCPGPQKGLPFGSRCDKVLSGVYGCTMNREAPPETSAPAPASTVADDGAESSGSSDDSDDADDANTAVDSADFCPGDEEFEMSVEGASGVYCIKGQACVADIADGVCPGPQKGLPFGSYCGTVSSGVYGCKVNSPPASALHKKAQHVAKKSKKAAHTKKHTPSSGKKTKSSKTKKVRGHDSSKKTAAAAKTKAKTKTAHHSASTKSKAAASKTAKSKARSHRGNHRGNSHGTTDQS